MDYAVFDDFTLLNKSFIYRCVRPAGTELMDTTSAQEFTATSSESDVAQITQVDTYTLNYFKNSNLAFYNPAWNTIFDKYYHDYKDILHYAGRVKIYSNLCMGCFFIKLLHLSPF